MDYKEAISPELRSYRPGRETEAAEMYSNEMLDRIEQLDARISDTVREKLCPDDSGIFDDKAEKQNRAEIVEFIRSLECKMPLGYALKRYICNAFGKFDEEKNVFVFEIEDKKGNLQVLCVPDYENSKHEISSEDTEIYINIWKLVDERFNLGKDGKSAVGLRKTDMRRFLNCTDECKRRTMFQIGFSLHMDNESMAYFLTNVLAEQTYNYRDPKEIIYHFCQTYPQYNNYNVAEELIAEYESICSLTDSESDEIDNYTGYAIKNINSNVSTKEQLLSYLIENRANFNGFSRTAYENFINLITEAKYLSGIPDDGKDAASNTEALAKELFLYCIPRTERTYIRKGEKIVENDFCPVNKESTVLYNDVLESSLLNDRMKKIIKKELPVSRKDLIILNFYNFCRSAEEQFDMYAYNFETFKTETNIMLNECGMAGLYALNRFDNLVMLSFWSEYPFEFFGSIISASFGAFD